MSSRIDLHFFMLVRYRCFWRFLIFGFQRSHVEIQRRLHIRHQKPFKFQNVTPKYTKMKNYEISNFCVKLWSFVEHTIILESIGSSNIYVRKIGRKQYLIHQQPGSSAISVTEMRLNFSKNLTKKILTQTGEYTSACDVPALPDEWDATS